MTYNAPAALPSPSPPRRGLSDMSTFDSMHVPSPTSHPPFRTEGSEAMPFDGVLLPPHSPPSPLSYAYHSGTSSFADQETALSRPMSSHDTSVPHIQFDPRMAYVNQEGDVLNESPGPRKINPAALAFYRYGFHSAKYIICSN